MSRRDVLAPVRVCVWVEGAGVRCGVGGCEVCVCESVCVCVWSGSVGICVKSMCVGACVCT